MSDEFLFSELLECDNEENDSRRQNNLRRRRRIREQINPFDQLDEREFIKRYRLSKELVKSLCYELKPKFKIPRKSTDLSVETKVLTALSFYATGSYQRPIGDISTHSMAQQTVSSVIAEVTACIDSPEMRRKYICFPKTLDERNKIRARFYKIFKFPGVLGCIDCTHIAIVRPVEHEKRFFNRKHYHSLNVQLICDADMQITSVDASYGGANHDSFIWNEHPIKSQMENLNESTWLLGGGCTFPAEWTGSWFQSGILGLIAINTTHIQSKGECSETESYDKFLLYDRTLDCYRCMVIHEKHKYVLQYKETYCNEKNSLSTICEEISGDAPLFSMFRKEPRPEPQPCPFHPAPFTFTYSRGSGDCVYPPSRAESCTDDSRLLLRYMACPDVPGTESNVEELVCLATWKEGSTRYLVGQISQVQRRNSIASDEDTYRCFIYKGQHGDKSTYIIAQSGDATCNGLSSPTDGSRTMKLTTSDDEHTRCHFPDWIVEHHKWFSLDHTHQYHFTTKNATLKIMNADGSYEEKRLVCHSILEQKDKKHIKLVAHVTRGCESGHVCLSFHYRVSGAVLELRAGALWDAPQDACQDTAGAPYVTLITTSLTPTQCPIQGRYSIVSSLADRRRRRQQLPQGDTDPSQEECVSGDYDSVSVGCGHAQDTIELKSSCMSTVYTCYGWWREGGRGFLVAAPGRGGGRPRTFCFMYTHHNESSGSVSLSAVSRACDRAAVPGRHGDAAYNLTRNGTCEQSSKYNSVAARLAPVAMLIALLVALLAADTR